MTGDSNFESGAGITVFQSRSFSISVGRPLAQSGDDIIEARWSVSQVTPVNEAKLTRIPYGTPYVETLIGSGIGVRTITGSVTAITKATALTWGQNLRSAASSGGYEKAPQEKMDTDFYPMSGTAIRVYRFDFTYSGEFATLGAFTGA